MSRVELACTLRSALVSGLIAVSVFAASMVYAQTVSFDLPAQDAATAIPEFARQAGLQIIAPVDSLQGIKTPRVIGTMDAHEALRRLLEGTGLVVASDDGHTISLRIPSTSATRTAPSPDEVTSSTNNVFGLDEVVVTGTVGSI